MISAEVARQAFNYDPKTGLLTRAKTVNYKSVIGQEAGWINGKYREVRCDGKAILVHRLIWLIVYGKWPENQIDHINGNGLDNRIENLRDVTNRENANNKKCHRNGSLPGATFHKRESKWQSKIRVGNKYIWLGYHKTKEKAHAAYVAAVNELDNK